MIVDLDQAGSLPAAGRYDLCIAGCGVAGIVLARMLAERGRRVLILEGGGLKRGKRSQDVYRGQILGRPYFDLDACRLRFLGGSSNHWGGRCRPLDAYDFVRRDDIEGSGWPIGIEEVRPYLARARDILEVDPFPEESALPSSDGRLKEAVFHLSPPVRFKDKYYDDLKASQTIDVYLDANLVKIDLDPGGGRIAGFGFRGYADGAPLRPAVADRYVLALGGIENARALLNATHQMQTGLGNETDLVGRFFMEHPTNMVGYYVTDPARSGLGRDPRFFVPTYNMMRETGIANCRSYFEPIAGERNESFVDQVKDIGRKVLCTSDVIADFVRSVHNFTCPVTRHVPVAVPTHAGIVSVVAEQVPNRNSRVRLSDDRDRFGQRRVALDWQLLPTAKKTMRTVALAVARYVALQDLARIKLRDWVLDEHAPIPGLADGEQTASSHHIGTTRMGTSKDDGVVDRDCRVFGIDNLYIAGSSVFRTAGQANPTLTIVQLALRLGDHLASL
jgi:choline dehydrogenase-like flavoprotein